MFTVNLHRIQNGLMLSGTGGIDGVAKDPCHELSQKSTTLSHVLVLLTWRAPLNSVLF